jgi:prepilin-type N-terminal cleavage/methylation domain-containing protein
MKKLLQKGFTVLELLIVLALIATAAVTAQTVKDKHQELVSKHPTHITK